MLTKPFGKSRDELEEIVRENFVKLGDGNVSDFPKKKTSGVMAYDFPTIKENDETHQMMMDIEPLLISSGYGTWRNVLLSHGKYPCHCLVQTFWYPKRANLVMTWDAGELFYMGLPDEAQNMLVLVISAMLAVKWLEANAEMNKQEMAVPTPEQLSKVRLSRKLDLFKTTSKILRIPKAILRISHCCR